MSLFILIKKIFEDISLKSLFNRLQIMKILKVIICSIVIIGFLLGLIVHIQLTPTETSFLSFLVRLPSFCYHRTTKINSQDDICLIGITLQYYQFNSNQFVYHSLYTYKQKKAYKLIFIRYHQFLLVLTEYLLLYKDLVVKRTVINIF